MNFGYNFGRGPAVIPLTSPTAPTAQSPVNTLLGSAAGLQINLVWDSSVRSASNWQAIESSITVAANDFVTALTTTSHTVINIAVGFGEVAGSRLSSGALGQSSSNGYITNYNTVSSALTKADANMGVNLHGVVSGANYFITSAEAKALGLVNGISGVIDGYIGITNNTSALSFSGTPSATQYDAAGIAAHEISEVLGRISMNGSALAGYSKVYSVLDVLHTGNTFSASINGKTYTNTFNAASGGDVGDWASGSSANDAFNAFGTPGKVDYISSVDLVEMAALGFNPTAAMLVALQTGNGLIA